MLHGAVNLLVVGGAGYIGSVTTEFLLSRGHAVTILDNFSTGYKSALVPGAEVVTGDITSAGPLLARHPFEAVLHFAAKIVVSESMERPGDYFANNIGGVINLVNAMLEHGVQRLVFSSTAAVYGIPEQVPVPESAPFRPNNPYGTSKAVVEEMLRWYGERAGLAYASLRYFNAAGASERFGEDHRPETHLIPLAVDAALGLRRGLELYGTDYPTPDGTAIRDYIHVLDLAEAHLLALQRLESGPVVCNLGSEKGYSVGEVIETVKEVTGNDFPVQKAPRRQGDAPMTIASSALAQKLLGWSPSRGLREMVESASLWRRDHPQGYLS